MVVGLKSICPHSWCPSLPHYILGPNPVSGILHAGAHMHKSQPFLARFRIFQPSRCLVLFSCNYPARTKAPKYEKLPRNLLASHSLWGSSLGQSSIVNKSRSSCCCFKARYSFQMPWEVCGFVQSWRMSGVCLANQIL